jgi:PAS domain S-box-containing protein
MVEDSETDANLILRQLQKAGYTVEYLRVENAAEMQAALDEKTWQIITADYSLPQFDAPSALALLQNSGLDIPFVVISGEVTEEMAVGLMKAGAQDYLMKSSLARLAPVLERELTQARKRQEQRLAEEAMKVSEERYRMLVNQAVDGIFIADPHGNLLDVNPSECAMFGYRREEILKLNVKDLIAPADLVNKPFHPDDLRAGAVLITQRNMIRKDGSALLVEISGKMLADGRMQGIMRDITERQRAENELRWLNRVYALTSQVNQMVVRTRDPQELYSNVCRLAIEYGKFRMAWIGLVDKARQVVVPVVWEGEEQGYLSIFTEIPFSDMPAGHGPTGMSISTEGPFFSNDIADDPIMEPWRDEALRRGYRASIALPIIVREKVIGAFTLYSGEPFLFNPGEINLLEEVTGDIAFALELIENEQRRIQAEESLRTTLQQLNFHIENTPLAVVQFDNDLRITYWSSRAREMFGWKAEEALGRRIDQLRWFHEQDAEKVALQRIEMLASRKTSTVHTNRNYRKNGSVMICQWYNSALLDPQGGLISLQSQILDISERVHAEDALRESEEKFRLLVDQSPSGIVILNQRGLITGWNRAQEKIYGVKKAEVVGLPGWEVQYRFLPEAIRTPEERQRMKASIQEILISGRSPSLNRLGEFEIHRSDGTRGWVETTAFVVKTNEGYISVTTTSDISERKLAEANLKENAAQLELVFNSTSDAQALFKVEPGERFVYQTTNRPYRELIEAFAPGSSVPVPGTERKEYLASLPIAMNVFERELDQYRRVLAERRPVYFELEFSIGNENVTLETSISPVLDPAGECSHLLWSARNISERKRIEEALYESNQRFSNAFEFAANGMALTALDGRWLKVNRALSEMVGYSIQELLNMNYRDVTHPEDLDVDQAYTRQILAGEINRYQLQKRFIHRSGAVVWVLLNISVVRDEQGQLLYSIAQMSNISELKRAEETLHLQSAALEYAANAIVITDRTGVIQWVNPAWSMLTGYLAEEVIGMNPRVLNSGQQDQAYYRLLWDTILRGEVWQSELVNKRKDGSLYTEAEIITPVRDDAGEVTHFVAIKQDITERKLAEQALRRSEESLRAIIQTAMDGFWMMDVQGHLLEVNDAYCRMSGYGKSELLGMDIVDLDAIEAHQTVSAHFQNIIEQGDDRFETRHRRKDGSIFDVEISVQFRANDGGRFVAFIQDITERKLAEEMIEKRIMTLTQPMNGGSITFEELFNLDEIQHIQDKFAQATGVASLITHVDGSPITAPSNFTYLCNEIIRKNPRGCANCIRSDAAIGRYHPDGPIVQPCLSGGLWDAGANITVGGHHIANWLIGQVRDQSQTEENMRAYAREIGADESAVIKAFHEVPAMSRKHFEEIAEALFTLANQLSTNAYQNVQQARFITERKRAEEALLDGEKRLHLALDAAKGGVWEWDLQTNKNIWSEELWKVYGLEPHSCEPSFDAWMQTVHPDDRAAVEQAAGEAARTGTELMAEWRVAANQDGSEHWLMSRGQSLRNADGQVVRMVGTVLDITERKRAEQALLQAHAELEQRVMERTADLQVANRALEKAARLKDEFLASMSHELRTPLTGILGLSEAMQMVTYGELNDRQRNAMKNIENSGRHLLALINDILDLSKIEAGRLDLQIEVCSLGEICQSSLQMAKGMASQKRQQVHFHMEPASILLKADARRVKQMMVNLLSNAIKFTPEGGSLGVEVRGSVERQELRIVIWDDGIGIQPEDQARLFQPFVQLDSSLSRQYAGTGLGLSLVQRLAEMHNGHVEVESSLGYGSRFTIVLPWLEVEVHTEQKAARGTSPLEMKIASPEIGPLVLIADDNEVVLEMLSDFLESRNYRVGVSRNGPEFLECLERSQADIILMDIQMPGMDGIEVIRRIRAHPDARTAALPVIAVTALAMAGDRERCLEAGANAYLSKPIQLRELIATIERLCLP